MSRWGPFSRTGIGGGLVAAFALVLALSPVQVSLPGFALILLEVCLFYFLYSFLLLGLNLQYGYAELINFGVVGFFAVGAYAAAILTAEDPFVGLGLALPWYVGVAGGILAGTLLGVVVGVSTLRLREDFLAIATLAAAEIFYTLTEGFQGFFGATTGITNVPRPFDRLAGNYDTALLASVLFLAGAAAVSYAALSRLTESPYGRVLRGIRANEDVTQALGKNTFAYKMQAFVFGAALAGLAGAVFVLINGAVAPTFITINVTVLVWAGLILGGAGNHRGALGGLAIIMGIRLATRFMAPVVPISKGKIGYLRMMILGLIIIVVIRYRPAGLWGDADKLGVDR
ncbi:MAG: branched-chain amino acid ABC transporter permease [Haloferacaceae archaeon]